MSRFVRIWMQRYAGWFFLAVGVFSPATHGQILLEPPPLTAPVSSLTIGDVDFLNSTTPKWLFTINLRTVDGTSVRASMSILLSIYIPGETPYVNAFVINTKEPHFTVNGSRTITNLDLGKTIPVERVQIRPEARRRLEEATLPSGFVPAGTYVFRVVVTPEGGTSQESDFRLLISNPSSLELLAPLNGAQLISPFPLFEWQFDGMTSRISVFEQLPGQSTLEEAASGVPHLVSTVQGRSFQYPAGGVRPLQPGKTYAWRVEGITIASGGTENPVRSQLRSFTIIPGANLNSWLLEELERILGSRYQGLFDQIRSEGMTPSGSFWLNEAALSTPELLQLLNTLRADPDAVTSASLE